MCIIIFSDNPIKEYIKSDIINVEVPKNDGQKCVSINLIELENLFKNNPNSIFYFFTYYCSPCQNAIEKGSSYDSSSKKRIIYISVDNITTIDKISQLAINNKNINNFYYLIDDHIKGYHFSRGETIFQKYAPTKNKEWIAYPFKLYTNKNAIIDSLSFGSIRIK